MTRRTFTMAAVALSGCTGDRRPRLNVFNWSSYIDPQTVPKFESEFGARVRYSGASFGFQLSAALGGGFSPIIATALAGYMGGTAGVSMMLILLAAITFVATLFATETKSGSLVD